MSQPEAVSRSLKITAVDLFYIFLVKANALIIGIRHQDYKESNGYARRAFNRVLTNDRWAGAHLHSSYVSPYAIVSLEAVMITNGLNFLMFLFLFYN